MTLLERLGPMLKNIALLAGAIALVSTPADATVHHKKHGAPKTAAAGAAIGGAVGLAAGGPGLVVGAVAGAALGEAVAKSDHAQNYAGYKYWKGWYYDGKGHRFTRDEMRQRIPTADATQHSAEQYKGFYGWYYDGKGHRFSYWKGSYIDEQGHRHSASEVSRHREQSSTGTHVREYAGFKYSNGWYYDGKGHRFRAEEMPKEAMK